MCATGKVMRVFDSGNLRVKFSHMHVWTICAEAVVKVLVICGIALEYMAYTMDCYFWLRRTFLGSLLEIECV